MNDREALKIFESCMNEMYKKSTPSTTWKDIKEQYDNRRLINRILKWFGIERKFHDKHSLSEQDYNEIKDKYCKKLNLYYQRKLDWFLLDYAPSFKMNFKKVQSKEGGK